MRFKILHIGKGLEYAFSHPLPSFHLIDIAIGIVGAVIIRLLVYFKGKYAKKYRRCHVLGWFYFNDGFRCGFRLVSHS